MYEDMSKGCCSKLQNIPFPVYVAAPVSPPIRSATSSHTAPPTSTPDDKVEAEKKEEDSDEVVGQNVV